MTSSNPEFKRWWGAFHLEVGDTLHWSIDALSLWIQRAESEWQVYYQRVPPAPAAELPWRIERSALMNPDDTDLTSERFAFRRTTETFEVRPRLADRSVVTRPVSPFSLPPGEEARIYISSPLWVSIRAGSPEPRDLLELPIARPSDTWFGPSTREGALCYATRTAARSTLANVAIRAHRAVTPLLLRNRARTSLVFERLNLPVEYLALYADKTGGLWTQEVTLEREADATVGTIQFDTAPPSEAAAPEELTAPRRQAEGRQLVRALTALLG